MSSGPLPSVRAWYEVPPSQLAEPIGPALTVNAGPPFSVKLNPEPWRVGSALCLHTFNKPGPGPAFTNVTRVSFAAVPSLLTVTVSVFPFRLAGAPFTTCTSTTDVFAAGISVSVCVPLGDDTRRNPEQLPPFTVKGAPRSMLNWNAVPCIPLAPDLHTSNAPHGSPPFPGPPTQLASASIARIGRRPADIRARRILNSRCISCSSLLLLPLLRNKGAWKRATPRKENSQFPARRTLQPPKFPTPPGTRGSNARTEPASIRKSAHDMGKRIATHEFLASARHTSPVSHHPTGLLHIHRSIDTECTTGRV